MAYNPCPNMAVTYVKVDRRCPRCHAHRMHFAHRSKHGSTFRIKITCAECGHDWKGRFLSEEWSEWPKSDQTDVVGGLSAEEPDGTESSET